MAPIARVSVAWPTLVAMSEPALPATGRIAGIVTTAELLAGGWSDTGSEPWSDVANSTRLAAASTRGAPLLVSGWAGAAAAGYPAIAAVMAVAGPGW